MAKEYTIVCNYMADGLWHQDTIACESTTMQGAWREASKHATELDELYGDSHFWNVNLRSEHGDIVQLFHGRLS
jgi:hypothetical protein